MTVCKSFRIEAMETTLAGQMSFNRLTLHCIYRASVSFSSLHVIDVLPECSHAHVCLTGILLSIALVKVRGFIRIFVSSEPILSVS